MLLYFTMNERDCFIKKIIKNKSINNNWIHNFSTNCYAYALGIDINEKLREIVDKRIYEKDYEEITSYFQKERVDYDEAIGVIDKIIHSKMFV